MHKVKKKLEKKRSNKVKDGGSKKDHGHEVRQRSGSDPDDLTENEEDILRKRRQDQEELEKALVEGVAGGTGDPEQLQSPDDVTILVTQEGGPGSRVKILIQLEESKSTLRILGESFITSIKESTKRKYSYIYVIALVIGTGFFGHIGYITTEEGLPVSAESHLSVIRLFISLGIMVVISPMAFFIVNLRIPNILFGVFWMFMIVSLLYFTSTSLSGSAYYIHKFTSKNKAAGQTTDDAANGQTHWAAMVAVYDYLSTHYTHEYNQKELAFLQKYSLTERCCDYNFFYSRTDASNPNVSIPFKSLWEGVFANDTDKRPPSCCGGTATCKEGAAGASKPYSKKCDRKKMLTDIYDIMIFVVMYTCVMTVLCIGMALVFWYYYSDLKAREFSLEEQPGDFALLNIHRPHREGQTIELTFTEKIRRQKRKRKLSKLRQKYGVAEHRHHHHHEDEEEEQKGGEEESAGLRREDSDADAADETGNDDAEDEGPEDEETSQGTSSWQKGSNRSSKKGKRKHKGKNRSKSSKSRSSGKSKNSKSSRKSKRK